MLLRMEVGEPRLIRLPGLAALVRDTLAAALDLLPGVSVATNSRNENQLVNALNPSAMNLPALLVRTPEAGERFVEFFTANIRNANSRRAYTRATADFATWCDQAGLRALEDIEPVHVGPHRNAPGTTRGPLGETAPGGHPHALRLRMLFDWLVVGQQLAGSPAAAVRGPRHSVKKGKTPVLSAEEARLLLDSIDTSTPIGCGITP